MNLLKKQKIGLALSGGATKGCAHFSIIEQLEKEKIKISYVSGTSVGAIIGAYYALYGEIEGLKEDILNFSKKDWFDLADFSMTNTKSLIKAQKYKKYLKSKFGNKTFKDTKIKLVIAATNLKTGKIEYISQGKIVDAIMASSAFPGVFPPIKQGDKIYADGGILDNLPYEILFKRKMSKVIGVNLGVAQKHEKNNFNSIFSIIGRSMDLMIDNAFKKINYEDNTLFIFEPKFKKGFNSMWDISNLNNKYEVGLKEFKRRKKDFLEWI